MAFKIGDEVWIRATIDGKPSRSGALSVKSGKDGKDKLWASPKDVVKLVDAGPGRTNGIDYRLAQVHTAQEK